MNPFFQFPLKMGQLAELEERICLLEELVNLNNNSTLPDRFNSINKQVDEILQPQFGLKDLVDNLLANQTIIKHLANTTPPNELSLCRMEDKIFIVQSALDDLQDKYEHLIQIQNNLNDVPKWDNISPSDSHFLLPFLQIKSKVVQLEQEYYEQIMLDQFLNSLLTKTIQVKGEIRNWIYNKQNPK